MNTVDIVIPHIHNMSTCTQDGMFMNECTGFEQTVKLQMINLTFKIFFAMEKVDFCSSGILHM